VRQLSDKLLRPTNGNRALRAAHGSALTHLLLPHQLKNRTAHRFVEMQKGDARYLAGPTCWNRGKAATLEQGVRGHRHRHVATEAMPKKLVANSTGLG
jgi:hypothetical protein